jgi:hypothetical protein
VRAHPAGGRRAAARALATDVGLIVLFAAAGRRAHADSGAVEETLLVAAPFAAGWLLGAVAVGVPRSPHAPGRALRAWAVGLPVGLALRAATGGGVAPAFVVVALLVNLVTLVGRRVAVERVARARARRRVS